MTGLNTKSADLITLLTATNTKLDAVAGLLAALTPPAPADFSDLLTSMDAANTKLATISTNIASMNTGVYIGNDYLVSILDSLIPTIGDANQPISTILTDMRRNELALMQGIIQAIILVACPCDPAVPQLPAPPATIPYSGEDEEKCKRVQKVVAMFTALIDSISSFISTGASMTEASLSGILTYIVVAGGLTGAEVGLIAGPPGGVVGAIIGSIAIACALLGAEVFHQWGIIWHTAPLIADLEVALFNANTSAASVSAFEGVMNATDWGIYFPFAGISSLLWYAAWSDLIYDSSIVLDTTGFDGTLCGQAVAVEWGDCINVQAIATVQTDPNSSTHNVYDADWSVLPGVTTGTTMTYSGGTISFSNAIVGLRDWNGTSFQVVSGTGIRVVWVNALGGTIAAHDLVPGDPPWTLTETTYALLVDDAAGGSTHGYFMVNVCPPA